MDTRHAPESGAPDAPLPAHPPVSHEPENPYRIFDLAKEASVAKLTSGLSPASLRLALSDWLIHLAAAPGKRAELATLAMKHATLLAEYLFEAATGRTPALPAQPSPGDRRFRA
ncbi:poly-beta-hydroxybutyrate polymerase N-terminal domain-containing protein, partial [Burkholderia thailandensis]